MLLFLTVSVGSFLVSIRDLIWLLVGSDISDLKLFGNTVVMIKRSKILMNLVVIGYPIMPY